MKILSIAILYLLTGACNVLSPKKDNDPPASFSQSENAGSAKKEVLVTSNPFGSPPDYESFNVPGKKSPPPAKQVVPRNPPEEPVEEIEAAVGENNQEEDQEVLDEVIRPPFDLIALPVNTRIDDNFIPFGDENEIIRQDLSRIRLDNPASLAFIRYISLGFLDRISYEENPEAFIEKKAILINSASFVLNSLSSNIFISPPQPVRNDFSLLRIDIRDYGWSQIDWEFLVRANQNVAGKEDYPYRHSFDPVFADLTSLTETTTPVVRGDWLVNELSLPGVYSRLLNLPGNLAGLGQNLNTNITANILQSLNQPAQNPRAVRAFLSSQNTAMALNNRVLERHITNSGSLWLSYDFQAPDLNPESDVASRPLGPSPDIADPTNNDSLDQSFSHDLSTAIFNLPNGLPAYFMADAAGRRINTASTTILLDSEDFDKSGLMRAPRSCIRCHSAGIKNGPGDELRRIMNSGLNSDLFSDFIREGILAIHVEKSRFDALVSIDNQKIATAISGTRVVNGFGGSVEGIRKYLTNLSVEDLASELNITIGQYRRVEPGLSEALRLQILPAESGGLNREVFEDLYDRLLFEIFDLLR